MYILDKAVKINFSKSQPFNAHLFYILYDEMGNVYKALVQLFELQTELATFLWNTICMCKSDWQTMTVQTWVFGTFSKMNLVTVSLQGKQ